MWLKTKYIPFLCCWKKWYNNMVPKRVSAFSQNAERNYSYFSNSVPETKLTFHKFSSLFTYLSCDRHAVMITTVIAYTFLVIYVLIIVIGACLTGMAYPNYLFCWYTPYRTQTSLGYFQPWLWDILWLHFFFKTLSTALGHPLSSHINIVCHQNKNSHVIVVWMVG